MAVVKLNHLKCSKMAPVLGIADMLSLLTCVGLNSCRTRHCAALPT